MGTIALIVSNIVNNRFVAILAPYIITEFANAILRMSDKKWLRGIAPTKLFNMAQTNIGASFIVYIAVLLILGGIVYFIGGLKHETYLRQIQHKKAPVYNYIYNNGSNCCGGCSWIYRCESQISRAGRRDCREE